MTAPAFRRVVYRSRVAGAGSRQDLAAILDQSRLNNGLDGLSGLLWTDGQHYVQLLEGPPESVAATLARILRDPRHEAVDVVADEEGERRIFADWFMADLSDDPRGDLHGLVRERLAKAAPAVRRLFDELS